jgi:tetratricopeptide (TPR) repeat protein
MLALAAAVLCVPTGGTALADLVQTSDGAWHGLPRDVKLAPGEEPGPEHVAASSDFKADATYETVKARGWTTSAGLVKQILASDQEGIAVFKEGMAQWNGNLPKDAAESFAAAAEEASGSMGKQQALFFRMLALADANEAPAALGAADELLAAFPNSYYFCDVQILRAKVAVGDAAAVTKALEGVKSAAGMNARDVFRAEHMRISLTLELAKKYDEARQAYEALIQQIDRGDKAQGALTRHRAQVGVGNCLLRANPPQMAEAKAAFEKILATADDPDALAAAHAGLGDVAFSTARSLQDQKKLPEAKEQLTEATLHYLRVTLVYRDRVTDSTPVLTAYENMAKAFVALFDQSGGKDCTAAANAYSAYFDLHGMLGAGPEKNRIAREAREFNNRRKEAGCR